MPHCKSPPLELTVQTARHLGVLHGASDDAIEATIALLPLGERIELAAHNVIATDGHGGRSADFALTEDGREAVARCAEWLESEPGGVKSVLSDTPEELAEELGRAAEGLRSSRHHRVTSS
jgi:hypothetical protein